MGGWTKNNSIVKIALQYNAKINLGQDKVDGIYNYISWPQKINNKSIMLMAAAGELFRFHMYDDEELPEIFLDVRDDLGLKDLCRKGLQKSVIANGTHENMFAHEEWLVCECVSVPESPAHWSGGNAILRAVARTSRCWRCSTQVALQIVIPSWHRSLLSGRPSRGKAVTRV